ncbi:MAG: hypothetical protein BM564_01660 [Bacteroidetes bacterium MedPE-SWsnd-G2]|nr:MAG: hypothetical protein BM564_01660 [Bacteroidetes bacterium MedPE-SWsnd-G2]
MKYSLKNTINKPHDEVITHFTNPDGLKHWMEGFERLERISGEAHSEGSKTNFHFIFKNKPMVIAETILEQNLPHQIKFAYESKMGYNEVEMKFEKASDNSTTQINNSYFELNGPMKYIGFLMKPLMKKQSLKYMTAFKAYAEKQ